MAVVARIIHEDPTTSSTIRPLGFDSELCSPPLRARPAPACPPKPFDRHSLGAGGWRRAARRTSLEPVRSTASKPAKKELPFAVRDHARIPKDS